MPRVLKHAELPEKQASPAVLDDSAFILFILLFKFIKQGAKDLERGTHNKTRIPSIAIEGILVLIYGTDGT